MNLTNFLKQTDAITANYSSDQLISFIRDIGRALPEYYREDFLKRLKAAGGKIEKEQTNDIKFHEMYKSIRNNLKLIDSQEVAITGRWVGDYSDWYDDDDEEFYCQDDSGIAHMLEEACDFVHMCMDMEKYKEGFEAGKQIFSMEILCTDEYGDREFLISDMAEHELLQCNLTRVCLDTMYCAYHAVPLRKRVEALYSVIVNAGNSEITLEKVMQYGDEELPDFQNFLTLWIAYLGTKTGSEAERLILEAVGLLDDISAAAEYAKKYADIHPELYLNILECGYYADAKHMAAVGMEAIGIIPKQYTVRGRAALKTAEYIIEAGENPLLLEKCYFAAYESDTCALNYLRALLNGYGTERKREELTKILASLYARKDVVRYEMFGRERAHSGREENKPDSNMLLLLRFLAGQFDDVLAKGLNKSEALGWSGTFMKQGIALYLLYLYEGKPAGRGIAAMADIVKSAMNFSEEEYWKGICESDCTNKTDSFYGLFLKWKSMMPMEPDVRKRAIKKMESLIAKRTEGIMSANRRNYYGECAAYIAALGEVKESWGETDAKQKLMTSYKDKYTARRAFREEMRNYGWIDVKVKRR